MALTPPQSPVILALNASGEAVAHRLADALGLPVHGRKGRVAKADAFFDNALDHARDLFAAGVPIIGVCASGILIRAVAPLLHDKRVEPPVLSVSDDGAAVIPLLGGHRGANRLAHEIAEVLGALAAVTTAGDLAIGAALDVPPAGYRLANPEDAKGAMAAMLSGAPVVPVGDNIFDLERGVEEDGSVCLHVADGPMQGGEAALVYHPQKYVLGVGCARGAAAQELWESVQETLDAAGVAAGAVACVATLDLKADEPAMNDLARRLNVPLRIFTAAELEAEAPRLQNPSDVVFAEVGCHGVSEGAALAAAGADATLRAPKVKTANTTCALAEARAPVTEMCGRARGHLSIVGIGPGQAAWRTPEVSQLVAQADELVGYGLYIDLLGPLAAGKMRSDFPLGGEEDRCRYALEQAGKGHNVALVCSGDAGIYALSLIHI